MMDRQEAIFKLNTMATNLIGIYASEQSDKRAEHIKKKIDALDMAIDALREQEQGKWISVKERLPEDGVRVLALHDDGVVRIGISSRGYCPSVVSKTSTKTFGIADVTHWMPLPEPPKEGAD